MKFSTDWFSAREATWREHVLPFLPDHPSWLEIGSFEGRSACWIADNVPGVSITCVDPFFPRYENVCEYERTFDDNTAGRVTKEKSHSFGYLVQAALNGRRWHGCYIDGDHEAKGVLEDFVLAWRCVSPGGVIVLDDYPWKFPSADDRRLPPGPAIDACLKIYGSRLNVLHSGWQVILQKVAE